MIQTTKRGDITFSQIVYAALALVILVVLIMVFTGQFGELSKKFRRAGEPTETQANKVGWCLDTLTTGKQCEYELSCTEIAGRVGGQVSQSWPLNQPPATTDCSQQGMVKMFSSSEKKFCCVKV